MMKSLIHNSILTFLYVGMILSSESFADRGDVTQDGIIDGRDALKVMRIVDGLEIAGPDDTELGDVFPNPGINGRRIGDGLLTRDDALVILRKEVGLVSEIEINGNYDRSAPWIEGCFPTSGAVGDAVTLIGGNFVINPSGDNSVFLGDDPAELLQCSGNLIVIRVPENAQSGLFRVRTPGGLAECPFEFRVILERSGALNVGGSLNPSDFKVTTPFGGEPVEASGSFKIQTQIDGITLVGAVTPDPEENNSFLALVIPEDDESTSSDPHAAPEESPVVVDALSTAKTHVFLFPFIFTNDIANAKTIYKALGENSDVQSFAEVIAERYSENRDGLDDPQVEEAYIKAVRSYMNSIPPGLTFSLKDDVPAAKAQRRLRPGSMGSAIPGATIKSLPETIPVNPYDVRSTSPIKENSIGLEVLQYNVDRFDVNANYDDTKNLIKPYLKDKYGPVDYITILYRIDPSDMPMGVNESFVDLRRRPLKTTNYRVGNVVQGKLWTQNIDVAYTLIDNLFREIGGGFFQAILPGSTVEWYQGSGLPLQDLEEGVYMLRVYSGSLAENDPLASDFESIDNIPGGYGWHSFAFAINMLQAAIDYWDFVTPDSKRYSRTFIKKGLKNVIRRFTAETAGYQGKNLSSDEIFKLVFSMFVDFLVAGATTSPQYLLTLTQEGGNELLQAKMKNGLAQGVKKGIRILDVLDHISSAGRVVERLAGLAGRIFRPQIPKRITASTFCPWIPPIQDFLDPTAVENPSQLFDKIFEQYFFTLEPTGPTPLESILYVVGKPFEPIIQNISPISGKRGDRVVITGESLLPIGGSVDVRFDGVKANAIEAAPNRLLVEIPNVFISELDASRTVDLTVETSASVGKAQEFFIIERFPVIESIEPVVGYAKVSNPPADSPLITFPGTEIVLKGDDLDIKNLSSPYDPYVDDRIAETIQESRQELTMRVPVVDPGETEIYVGGFSRETARKPFLVLGPPKIDSITPLEIKGGQFVTIAGENLSTVYSKDRRQLHVDVRVKDTGGYIETAVESFSMTSAIFQIKQVVDFDSTLAVTIWNPSGASNAVEIELKAGSVTYNEVNKPQFIKGLRMTVADNENRILRNGLISLDEAASFARGSVDPFSSLWDDRNEKWTIKRTQMREVIGQDDDGNPIYRYYWEESAPDKEELTTGNGPSHEIREIYYIDKYHFDNGGHTTEAYLAATVDLDEKEEDREEGDVVAIISGEIEFGENYAYDGAKYADDILVPAGSDSDLFAYNPSIGAGDRLRIESSSHLQIVDGFEQNASHCEFLIQNVTSTGPIVIKGSDVKMRWNRIQFEAEGLELQNSYASWLYGVGISNVKGTGLYVTGGGGNTIDIGEISNCSQGGLHISSSDQNEISGADGKDGLNPHVHDCAYGFVLEGGQRNRIRINVSKNLYNGIDIENTERNQINGSSFDNTENGVNILGRFEENDISIHSYNNANGFVFEADGNLENNQIGGSCYNNKQYGVHIKDNAVNNRFFGISVYGNGSHGVLLEGEYTYDNDFVGCFIGRNDSEQINGGDGVRLQNYVESTLFEDCYITGNQGNGIYLGPNVYRVRVKNCCIGYTDLNYDPIMNHPNFGWGMLALDKPKEIHIEDSYFGINESGGMRVVGAQPYENGDGSSFILERITIGYKRTVYGMDREYLLAYSGLEGVALDLEDVKSATIDTVFIAGHDSGVRIKGEKAESNKIKNLVIERSKKNGCEIIAAASNTLMNISVTGCGGDGVKIESAKGTAIHYCTEAIEKNTGAGISIKASSNTVIDNVSLRNNGGHGIAVDRSSNTIVRRCETVENDGDGLSMVNQCVGATLDWAASSQNKGNGYSLSGVKNAIVTLLSDEGRFFPNTPSCYQNEGNGFFLQNCDNVHIGVLGNPGRGLSIDDNKKRGIWIQGVDAGRITIQGNSINSNLEGGVQVDAGAVDIGGFDSSLGNFLSRNREFNIMGSGSSTHLNVLSNIMETRDPLMDVFIGAKRGVVLTNGIHNVRVDGNEIYNHKENGIVISEGANNNDVQGNRIEFNAQNGILIQGSQSSQNLLTRNTITGNLWQGIKLDGGNNGIQPPIMRRISGMGENLSGVVNAPLGSVVEVYADGNDEGETFLGSTMIQGNEFFIKKTAPLAQELHAIVIDPDGNTSEFGPNEIFTDNRFGSVLYVMDRDGQTDLFFQQDTDWIPTQLTDTPYSESDPNFSPDGKQILFVSDKNGNRDVWVMDNNGENARSLIQNQSDDYDPAWSPDGRSVAFVSENEGNSDVYVRQIESGGRSGELIYNGREKQKTLKVLASDGVGLYYSTDPGILTEIRFYIEKPAEFAWKIFAYQGITPTELLHEGVTIPTEEGWHSVPLDNLAVPSEFVVAFFPLQDNVPEIGLATEGSYSPPWRYKASEDRWIFDWRFFMIEAVHSVSSPKNLTENPSNDRQPVWSPTGEKIAFASDRSGSWDIWVTDADGSNLVSLTHGEGDNTSPAWIKYGTVVGGKIAFVSTRNGNPDIYVMDADGTNVELVADRETAELDPAWNLSGWIRIYFSADYGSGKEIYALAPGSSNLLRVTNSNYDALQPNVAPPGFNLLPPQAENPAKVSLLEWIAAARSILPSVDMNPLKAFLPEINALPGDTITLTFSIQGAVDLGCLNVRLLYDEEVLDLQNISKDRFANDSVSISNPEYFDYDSGMFRYSGVRSDGVNGEKSVLDLIFKVSDQLYESDDLEITFERIALYDVFYNPLPFEIQNGLVHVMVEGTNVESWMVY